MGRDKEILQALNTINARQMPAGGSSINSVSQSASSVTLAEANPRRKALLIYNNTSNNLYYSLSTADSDTSSAYSNILPAGEADVIMPKEYCGKVTGIWDGAGAGAAQVTETF